MRKHTTAITSFFPSLFNKHWAAALVAFTAILGEFLDVALSGLPYRQEQLANEFFFCGISSMVTLAMMVLVILAVNLWRRNLPHLLRKLDNAAAVMTYLANSRIVADFDGLDKMNGREREKERERERGQYKEY
jgi:hypothetical protein